MIEWAKDLASFVFAFYFMEGRPLLAFASLIITYSIIEGSYNAASAD